MTKETIIVRPTTLRDEVILAVMVMAVVTIVTTRQHEHLIVRTVDQVETTRSHIIVVVIIAVLHITRTLVVRMTQSQCLLKTVPRSLRTIFPARRAAKLEGRRPVEALVGKMAHPEVRRSRVTSPKIVDLMSPGNCDCAGQCEMRYGYNLSPAYIHGTAYLPKISNGLP